MPIACKIASARTTHSMKSHFLIVLRQFFWGLWVIGMAMWATTAHAQSLHEFTLSNGMHVIVKVDAKAPTAVHMVWLRVGSMDEVDGVSGVAHVLEHMLFKGSPMLKPGEFSRRVAAMGGRENAFTNKDYTGYFQQIPAHRLPDVMRLEADRFVNNQWPDDEFTREIEVVKEERRMRTDDVPRMQLYEQLNATQFIASPYRRPVVGWMNDLDAMKPQDARDFYKRWYVPANAAVVIVGDVKFDQVKQWAEEIYGRIPAAKVPERKPRLEPEQTGIRRLQIKAPAEQAYVVLSWKVPGFKSFDHEAHTQDALALTMLAAVLDGYAGARLERALAQGDQRIADSVGASNGLSGRGPQTFSLEGVPAKGKTTEQLEAALREQIARIAKEGVNDAEMRRVRAQWLAANIYQRDSLFNQAREIGTYWVEGLPADTSDRLVERLVAVTPEQIQKVAQTYFGDDNLTVATLLPQSGPRPAFRKPPPGARHSGVEGTR